jgi:hypothetical protein
MMTPLLPVKICQKGVQKEIVCKGKKMKNREGRKEGRDIKEEGMVLSRKCRCIEKSCAIYISQYFLETATAFMSGAFR